MIKAYLRYWLNAVNQHSLHAPFVYDFYTRIIQGQQENELFDTIESYRHQYLQDENYIKVTSPGAPSRVSNDGKRKISRLAQHGISKPKNSRLLYRIIQDMQPEIIVELGSSLGINTLYLSAAYPQAQVYTFEGCKETAQLAAQLYDNWPIKNISLIEGNIDETLPRLCTKLDRIDFAYLDANHRFKPTVNYFNLLMKKSSSHSILILDDIYWSEGMYQAWKTIISKPEISLSLDLFELGIVFCRKLPIKQHYTLMY